jgi:hypothetical protein
MPEPVLLVVRSEPIDPTMAERYHEWYEGHVRLLLTVPGILSGRRFESVDGEPRYMAMYEVEDSSVLESEAYLSVRGFGEMAPHVRYTRNVYRQMSPVDTG